MATTLDAADARFLALLTKSADRSLVEAAEQALAAIPVRFIAAPDLIKVGPKGYIHGWIYVGPHPNVGQLVHQVKKDRKGNVVSERHGHISRITNGHVHVAWDDGKKNIVQHVHDDKHPGGLVERGKHEGGADHFSTALAAGTSANRRKKYDEAAAHYDLAAEHAPDDKTRAEMKSRADAARARTEATPATSPPKPPTRDSAKRIKKPTPGRVATNPREFKTVDEMETWGKQHFEHDTLSRAQQKAVTYYSHAGDREMNGVLRGPAGRVGPPLPPYLEDEARAHIRELDSVMAPVPEDVMAFRATSLAAFQGVEPRAGMVFTDPGFMSTTLDATFLDTVTPGVAMHISVPKGARAHYFDGLSQHEDERELLLARGVRLRFTRVHRPEFPESGEQWVIDAEVVLPDGK